MKRILISISVLVVLQLAMVGVWLMVERSRKPESKTEALGSGGSVQTIRVGRLAPDFLYQLPNGSVKHFRSWRGQPVIVHFWATWCPPCRRELPALLAFARRRKLSLLAVSVDDSWKNIRALLGPKVQEPIVLAQASGLIAKRYGVTVFPVTYIVNEEGYLKLQFDGARDWQSGLFLKAVMAAMK